MSVVLADILPDLCRQDKRSEGTGVQFTADLGQRKSSQAHDTPCRGSAYKVEVRSRPRDGATAMKKG